MRDINWRIPLLTVGGIIILAMLFFMARSCTMNDDNALDTNPDFGEETQLTISPTETPDDEGQEANVSREEYPSVNEQEKWATVSTAFASNVIPSSEDKIDGWEDSIKPHITQALFDQLSSVDKNSIPTGTKVSGPTVLNYGQNYVNMEAKYDTNGITTVVRFRVVKVNDTDWKIDTYQPTKE